MITTEARRRKEFSSNLQRTRARTRNIPNLQAPVPETFILGGVCGAYLQKKTHSVTPIRKAETWLAFGLGRDLYQEDLQVLAHYL